MFCPRPGHPVMVGRMGREAIWFTTSLTNRTLARPLESDRRSRERRGEPNASEGPATAGFSAKSRPGIVFTQRVARCWTFPKRRKMPGRRRPDACNRGHRPVKPGDTTVGQVYKTVAQAPSIFTNNY